MPRLRKLERNTQLYTLRKEDPTTYTFAKLGKVFDITPVTAHEIYHREAGERELSPPNV